MPLHGHIASAWSGKGCIASGVLPKSSPWSKRNHCLATRALWDGGLPDGQGKWGTGRTLTLVFGSSTSCSSLLHPPPLPKNLSAMSPSQHSDCLGKQILATPKYPGDGLLCDGRQLPWKPPSNKKKKKKEKTLKFKAALVAQRNCRPHYGFWQPPFFLLFVPAKSSRREGN